MTHRVQGIILNKHNFRESDRLFAIYTDKLGKIQALARGSRKIKSKMAGHLDLFSIIDLMVAPGRNFWQIAGAETIKNFNNLKLDFLKIILCSHCLELVDCFVKFEQKDLKIFNLLKEMMQIFDEKKNEVTVSKCLGLVNSFSLKFLSLLGYAPELFHCAKCKKPVKPNGNIFDSKAGGLICPNCARGGLRVSCDLIKILRLASENNPRKFLTLKLNKNQLQEFIKTANVFVKFYQDKELKSEAWIDHFYNMSS